jgi:predicted transcriptional regulator
VRAKRYYSLMTQRIAIDLDDNIAARLEAAARQAETSAQALAAAAIARAVDDLEAWAEDEAAYAEYERTDEAIPLASMRAWVNSWGQPNELPPPEPIHRK